MATKLGLSWSNFVLWKDMVTSQKGKALVKLRQFTNFVTTHDIKGVRNECKCEEGMKLSPSHILFDCELTKQWRSKTKNELGLNIAETIKYL